MNRLAINSIRCAAIYAIAGMALGIYMAASGDHVQAPTHAHVNLLGWVTLAIMGLVYRAYPGFAEHSLAKVQFLLMNLGILGMIGALFMMFSGQMEFEVLAAVAAADVLFATLIFAYIVYRGNAE